MKKILIFALIVLMLSSCSTYYGKYEYDRYFQNNEPFVTVDSEEEAASFIARKLARQFKRRHRETLSVLSFTDEYGDRINRGDFFARMVIAEMTRYRNPIVVERESLYEIIKERELSMTNLIDNEGYELKKLLQADYILHGRILRGKHEDMISVRCFRVGSGEVVYAATVSIDYTPEPVYVPTSPPPPTVIVVPGSSGNPTQPPSTGNDDNDPIDKPDKKPSDGIESKGKIDLDNNKKKPTSGQYQYKEAEDDETVKKPSSSDDNESVKVKPVTIEKTKPVKKKTVKKKEIIQEEPKKEAEEKSKSSTSGTVKSTIKKK